MSYGIDYGNGATNMDQETGIRFGVIPQNDVLQSWADSCEPDYGEPTCSRCGNVAQPIDDAPEEYETLDDWTDNGGDYCCPDCRYSFEQDEACGDEPIAWNLDDGEYVAQQGGDDCDIFVTYSPYFTLGPFCSPCAPGAIYLRDGSGEGNMAYCFAPDWLDCFDDSSKRGEYNGCATSCPYPVFRVDNGECVYRPAE